MLKLKALKDFPATVNLEIETEGLEINNDEVAFGATAEIKVELIRGDNILYCRGEVTCPANLLCVRCLASYRLPLKGELEFAIRHDENAEVADDLSDAFPILEAVDDEVDVSLPVREALLLAVPMKPLCSEDCQGLCSQCGADLNETACRCERKTVDSRWEGLKDIIKDKA